MNPILHCAQNMRSQLTFCPKSSVKYPGIKAVMLKFSRFEPCLIIPNRNDNCDSELQV